MLYFVSVIFYLYKDDHNYNYNFKLYYRLVLYFIMINIYICFNNEFICIFISPVFYIFMTNAAKLIFRSRTTKFYCIALCCFFGLLMNLLFKLYELFNIFDEYISLLLLQH